MTEEKFRWTALILTGIIIIVYFLQISFPNQAQNFLLVSSKALERPWTVFTYAFLHGSFSHLFFNMFALVMFGLILESIVGYKKFLIIFFLSSIASGIVTTFFYSSVVGASGAIFGIIGVLGVIRPKMSVLVFGVPLPMIVAVIIWAIFDLLGVFYPGSNVAYFGHLGGLVFGLAVGLKLRNKYKLTEKKEKKFDLTDEEFRRWEETYMGKNKS